MGPRYAGISERTLKIMRRRVLGVFEGKDLGGERFLVD